MAKAAEKFEIVDAKRENGQALIIGLEGPPGGGKTFSALRLAKGIQTVRGGPIVVVDSDNERAAAYADYFEFKHLKLRPPFRPLRYRDAVRAANALKPAAIIIDSQSDEHEGEGGVLDYHEDELQRMAGDDWGKRERVGQAAWIKPKAERLAMINAYLQLEGKTPLILCFRARQKVKPIKNEQGKTVPTNIGWQPIAPTEITGNCTVLCLLPPSSDGVPKWKTGVGEEDFVLKLPIFAKPIFEKPGALSEAHGEALARWARGDDLKKKASPAAGKSAGADERLADGAQGENGRSPPADDDFPGDRKFKFKLVNLKGAIGETEDGEAWAAELVKRIAKGSDEVARKTWDTNKTHVEAAENAGHTLVAQQVWVAAQKRGLTE